MNISSRTPEGEPNRCPVCGAEVKLEPSTPAGDAPCPTCGSLLWFVVREPGVVYYRPLAAEGRETGVTWDGTVGQRVRIREGPFENYDGEVSAVDAEHQRVTLTINIFGRPTSVELEPWMIERV